MSDREALASLISQNMAASDLDSHYVADALLAAGWTQQSSEQEVVALREEVDGLRAELERAAEDYTNECRGRERDWVARKAAQRERDDALARLTALTSDAAVEAAVNAVSPVIPNTDGVVWEFTHEDGQVEPVTLRYAMQTALAAAVATLPTTTEGASDD